MIAYIGCYGGGIQVLHVSPDGSRLAVVSSVAEPGEAGYLAYAPTLGTLYAVDERKTDGRGPAGSAAAVHALAADPHDGTLTWLNSQLAPGPFPTYLAVDETRRILISANHGSFEHVERVIRQPGGGWSVEYLYDDSTVLLYGLEADGRIGALRDVRVLTGHGTDPNGSPQAGGHGQASPHAHCAVLDPSGRYLLVCDKATDQITVHTLDGGLDAVATYRFPAETGPRHLVFDPASGTAYATCEFSSQLASLSFDANTGHLDLLDRCSTVGPAHHGLNEPADLRLHPNGRLVYVNNRGEDTLAWFGIGHGATLTRLGHVPLAPSAHPGLAARSFALAPSGSFLLAADRPAGLVRSFAVDADGSLHPLAEATIPEPAFVAFAELPAFGSARD